MILIILLSFFSLMVLVVIHEWGHFILAKKFGIRVDEFGIGFPPRLFGKKFGDTLYSLNLLPFGAFVRIYGEDGDESGPNSFSGKPVWQRALVILGGVITFWITAAIILSVIVGLGPNVAIADNESQGVKDPKVQVTAVAAGSPAEVAGLVWGDVIRRVMLVSEDNSFSGEELRIDKVGQLQDVIYQNRGRKLVLEVERGKDSLQIEVVPRIDPPKNEGPMGIALMRTATKKYPWYQAPLHGIIATGNMTVAIAVGWWQALDGAFHGESSGAQVMGPVGIFSTFVQVAKWGVVYFLQFIALISIHLALFNILPIPVVDGGRLLFLLIEGIRKKPLNRVFEQRINMAFFSLLILLMVWVTIKDVIKLF